MPKRFQEMSKKEIRKEAHKFANLHKNDAGRMMSLAMSGGSHIFAHSGAPAGKAGPLNPYPTYLIEYQNELPWNGLTPVAGRPHNCCAEAHIWCEIKARGKEPRNFVLVSFNSSGVIASPCANCAQWVEQAFGQVYKETPAYEGRSKQKP